MGLLRRLWLALAARPYARKLPRAMSKGWGRSAYYTPGQIRSAVRSLGLDRRYIAFGFATFLPEEEFLKVADEAPVRLAYVEARAAVLGWLGARVSDTWNPSAGAEHLNYDPPSWHGHHGGDGVGHH